MRPRKRTCSSSRKFQGFQQILAPFTGKIAARNIDVGTLVTAGTGNSGTPLFSLVQSDVLRVYVFAPQENAPRFTKDWQRKLFCRNIPVRNSTVRSHARRRTRPTIAHHAGGGADAQRTRQTYAGISGQVKFLLPDDNAPIVVPADAFVFRAPGTQVVTLTNDNRIHWQKISIGRDFGTATGSAQWPEGKYGSRYESNRRFAGKASRCRSKAMKNPDHKAASPQSGSTR